MILLLLVSAYVSLPWWLPESWLRAQIEADLEKQFQMPVHLEEATVSWDKGVVLRGLTISSPRQFAYKPLLEVREIRADFSPLTWLTTGSIEWVELLHPQLHIHINPQGQSNLLPLAKADYSGDIQRLSIRNARISVELPGPNQELRLGVHDMQILSGKTPTIGRITLSGGIDQRGGDAPLSMRAGITGDEPPQVSLAFSGVDIQQLYLRELLNLPLKRLSGKCSGSLFLEVSREGIVDELACRVTIEDLDVQPEQGPALPVIEDAGISLSATYDPLESTIHLRRGSIRIPGVDLQARGILSDAILAGHWQGLRELQIQGSVFPSRLVALLTGTPDLGPYRAQGPVDVSMALGHEGHKLQISASAQAGAMQLLRGSKVLKPFGTELRGGISTTLDDRTWDLQAQESFLELAGNRFEGSGSIRDLEAILQIWARPEPGLVYKGLALVRNMQWQGRMEINDLPALQRLPAPWSALPASARAQGPLRGEFFLGQPGRNRLALHLDLPPGARLEIPPWIQQPEGAKAHLMISGRLTTDRVALEDLTAQLVLDHQQLLHVTRGELSFVDPGQDQHIQASGRYQLARMEKLLSCLPRLGAYRDKLSGANRGGFQLQAGPDHLDLQIRSDLSAATIEIPHLLHKPPAPIGSQGLDLSLHLPYCAQEPARASFDLQLAQGGTSIRAEARLHRDPQPRADFELWTETESPGRILAMLPPAMPLEATYQPGGRTHVHLKGQMDATSAKVAFELADASSTVRFAPGDTIVSPTWADGRVLLESRPGGLWMAKIQDVRLGLARQQVVLSGQAILARDPDGGKGRIREAELTALARLEMDSEAPGRRFLPRHLWQEVEKLNMQGAVQIRLGARQEGRDWALEAEMNADALALRYDAPGADSPDDKISWPVSWNKAANSPLTVSLQAQVPRSLDEIDLKALSLRSPALAVDAIGRFALDAQSAPFGLQGRLSGAIWTDDASKLGRSVRELKGLDLQGKAFLYATWRNIPEQHHLDLLLQCRDLTGTFRNKRVGLDGQLRWRDLRLSRAGELRDLGKVETDCLEVRAGRNHLYLLGNAENLTSRPSGKIRILATYLSQPDLQRWLWPPKPPRPASVGDRIPTREVRKQAEDLLQKVQQAGAAGDLQLDMQCGQFVSFDPRVQRPYTVHDLKLRGTLRNGRFDLSYRGMLNGGTYQAGHRVNLQDEQPVLNTRIELIDVLANENMQPQLELQFPGNTVMGTFSRDEQLSIPLVDEIARTLNRRYPAFPSGQAVTVTTEGFLLGRAAPEFLTDIFPGLNLTHYRYSTMTAFAQLSADGSAENDMIFDGEEYDVYMEGQTDVAGRARYQIGLLVLGSGQTARWHHNWRQGRLPLLKVRARIENGKLVDQQVKLPWPNETLGAVFVRNSIFYRMWVNWQREKQKTAGNNLPSPKAKD